MVFPLFKLIFIYQPLVYLDGISSIKTYFHLPTTALSPLMVVPLPKLIFIYRPLPPSMVFLVSKLIFIYQPLIYLDGISSIQTYIHLPTTYLPRWYFLYSNLYSFTNHLYPSMVFPLPKHIFIYRPLPPSMVFPVSKLILFYQPLVYLDGISSI